MRRSIHLCSSVRMTLHCGFWLHFVLWSLYWPNLVAARSKTWVCAAHMLGLWARFLPETWMSFSYECCVLAK